MMAEQPSGVFALVKSIAERSLWLLTYRPDLGDMGDVGMAIFHFFHRQKMYFEIGFILKELVVPNDGGATTWRFCFSEARGGKEPAKAVICEPDFFGSVLVESARILGLEIGNDFDRKNAICY